MGMLYDQEERPGDADRLASSAAVTLDPRLADVWQLIWNLDGAYPGETLEPPKERDGVFSAVLGPALRLAYLTGYLDARSEAEPGALIRELGLRVPRAEPSRRARRLRHAPTRSGNSDT